MSDNNKTTEDISSEGFPNLDSIVTDLEPMAQQSSSDDFSEEDKLKHNPKKPERKFNPTKFTFEYADENLRKIRELRDRLHYSNMDPLAARQREMELGLTEIGLDKDDLGKTGDSRTGEINEKHKKIAKSQVEDAKQYIISTRLAQGKKITR